jgi:hypothetical protein
MKTAVTITQKARIAQIQRLAGMIIEELTDIMPELASICSSDDHAVSPDGETSTALQARAHGKGP